MPTTKEAETEQAVTSTPIPRASKLPDSEVFDRDDYDKLTPEDEDEIAARLEKIMIRHRAVREAMKETNPLEKEI